jgi:Uma2 family endonuclease
VTEPAVIFEDQLSIPADVHDLERFRAWCHSPAFPERGRIDFVAGDIEVDMSPEDLYTHGATKTAISAALHSLVVDAELGAVFSDRTRIISPEANLSAEPDVVLVFWRTLEQGRVREVPATSGKLGRYVELEGAPDLVVEILSDSSMRKDTHRLPPLYAKAGIPELWLADARGDELVLDCKTLDAGDYRSVDRDTEGWFISMLDRSFRLVRHRVRDTRWRYSLEHR